MSLNIQSAFTIVAGVTGQPAIDRFVNSLGQGNSAGDKFKGTILSMKGALGALGVVLSGAALLAWAKHCIEAADAATDMAESVGVSTQSFISMSIGAKTAGVDAAALTQTLAKLNQKLFDAATGNEDAAALFSAVGISLKEIKSGSLTADQALERILQKVSAMPDGFAKTAMMMDLMGRSGYKLLPMADKLGEFKNIASEEAVQAAAKLSDMLDAVGQVVIWLTVDALGGLTSALGDVIDGFMELVNNEGRYYGFWQTLGDLVKMFFTIVGESIRFISIGVNTVMKVVDALVVTLNKAAQMIEAIINRDFSKIPKLWNNYKDELGAVGDSFMSSTLKMSETSPFVGQGPKLKRKTQGDIDTSGLGDDGKKLRQAIQDTEKKIALINAEAAALGISNFQKELSTNLQEMENRGIKQGTAEYERLSKAMTAAVFAKHRAIENRELDEWLKKEGDILAARDQEISLIGASELQIKQAQEARRIDNEVREKSKGLTKEGIADLQREAEAMKQAANASLERADAAARSWDAGTKTAFRNYIDNATDAAKQAEGLFGRMFQGMEDALTNFVMTGKLNFQQFANDIIKELIRIQIRRALAGFFGNMFGFGGGSAAASSAVIAHTGGIIGSTSLPGRVVPTSLFSGAKQLHGGGFIGAGEVPAILKRGEGVFTPEQMNAMGGGPINVVVNVNTDSGKDETKGDGESAEFGRRIAAAVKGIIIEEQRPGGLLQGARA